MQSALRPARAKVPFTWPVISHSHTEPGQLVRHKRSLAGPARCHTVGCALGESQSGRIVGGSARRAHTLGAAHPSMILPVSVEQRSTAAQLGAPTIRVQFSARPMSPRASPRQDVRHFAALHTSSIYCAGTRHIEFCRMAASIASVIAAPSARSGVALLRASPPSARWAATARRLID